MKKDTARWSATVAVRLSMYAASGAAIRAKVLKPYCLQAYAKVSCRLVPHQDHHKISQLFADYIMAIAPDTVQVKVTPMHGGQGYVCPITLPAYQAAEKGFAKAFGKKPLAVRRGGSIPIISTFEQVLGIKTILMGFGLESNAIHSPNENIPLDILRKGIEAVIEFHLNY